MELSKVRERLGPGDGVGEQEQGGGKVRALGDRGSVREGVGGVWDAAEAERGKGGGGG